VDHQKWPKPKYRSYLYSWMVGEGANRSTVHDVVQVAPRDYGRRRKAAFFAATALATVCVAVVWLDGSAAKDALALAYAYSGTCDGCVPIPAWNPHADAALSGHRVAQRAAALRELYESANEGGRGWYPDAGAPAFYAARGALTVMGGGATPASSIWSGAPAWEQPNYSLGGARPSLASEGLAYTRRPGYRLVWVPNKPEPAREYGGRDEVPYYPMPSPNPVRGGGHEVFVPHDCAHTDGYDPECRYKFQWTDQYPQRPLITRTFPHEHYYPATEYPFIKGPFKHHLVNDNGHPFGDSYVGHWVWVSDNGSAGTAQGDTPADEPTDRYSQRYGQDGR
jgi:hypothetical protein